MAEVGKSVARQEAWQKVCGEAIYADDFPQTGFLHARIAASPHAHARLLSIDTSDALAVTGVKLVLTGADCPQLFGPLLRDRPLLAQGVVRYAGEPVALVVAQDEAAAALAVEKLQICYEPLPAVFEPDAAFDTGAPLLHSGVEEYSRAVDDVFPVANSNASGHYPVRRGDMNIGWGKSEYTVTKEFRLSPSAHVAMELRTARARISRDGMVDITTASQAPYEVVKQISDCFGVAAGNIRVHVPLVGGAFGGKAPMTLEPLAFLASQKLGGVPVRLAATRQQDFTSLPCRAGMWARVKLGADKNGRLCAAEIQFLLDNGAYSDIGPYMAKAIAADCTGPYSVDNLSCDSYSVYTNRTYATSFRGFAHESATFCIERSMDALAETAGIDPLEFRRMNAIMPGTLTPTQVRASESNVGNLPACIDKLSGLGGWGTQARRINEHIVRARGCACFWKSPAPPVGAVSGALVTVNSDGSFNLATGAVEIGSGGQGLLAQMLADKLGVSTDQIHTELPVDTRLNPEHYKTVASLTAFIAGRAVMRAANDILAQIRSNAAHPLGCSEEDVEVGGGYAFVRHEPDRRLLFKDILFGYHPPQGSPMGEPVIGRGGFMLKGISALDPQTGKGRSAPSWTLGAESVEIELDERDCSYRILNAYCAIDLGKAINPADQEAMVRGGMAMGLSLASRESFSLENGALSTTSLRNYKVMHFSERPKYHVAFVETPQEDSPYGTRAMSEHGILGMPAALANALSAATGVSADTLPITPESLWRGKGGAAQ